MLMKGSENNNDDTKTLSKRTELNMCVFVLTLCSL